VRREAARSQLVPLALPFAVKAPNAATRDAIAELETGKGAPFRSGAALRVTCMRTIERAGRFKRDYKREAGGERPTSNTARSRLTSFIVALGTDPTLEARYRDHELSGDWAGYRERHLKPDVLLIYRTSEPYLLRLARLGSHSDLFG